MACTTDKESNGQMPKPFTRKQRRKRIQQVGNNSIPQPKHTDTEKNSDTVANNSAFSRDNLIHYSLIRRTLRLQQSTRSDKFNKESKGDHSRVATKNPVEFEVTTLRTKIRYCQAGENNPDVLFSKGKTHIQIAIDGRGGTHKSSKIDKRTRHLLPARADLH